MLGYTNAKVKSRRPTITAVVKGRDYDAVGGVLTATLGAQTISAITGSDGKVTIGVDTIGTWHLKYEKSDKVAETDVIMDTETITYIVSMEIVYNADTATDKAECPTFMFNL